MNYSTKDLGDLMKSTKFKEFRDKNARCMNLGEKIYARRKDLRMTQKELSKLTGIPQNKISQLESGTYGEPGFDVKPLLNIFLSPNHYLVESSR